MTDDRLEWNHDQTAATFTFDFHPITSPARDELSADAANVMIMRSVRRLYSHCDTPRALKAGKPPHRHQRDQDRWRLVCQISGAPSIRIHERDGRVRFMASPEASDTFFSRA